MDVAALADLLHETAERHGRFEAVAPPHDWWDWYAAYMDARESTRSPEDASTAAERYMAEISTSSSNPSDPATRSASPGSGPRPKRAVIPDSGMVGRYGSSAERRFCRREVPDSHCDQVGVVV